MKKIHIKYGVSIALGMIIYFLILKLMGLHKYPIFSAVNGLIIGFGLFYALKDYKKNSERFSYGDGFKLGVISGLIASFLFVLFMSVYIFYIDTDFTNHMLNSWDINFDIGAQIILFSIFIMSFSTTVVLTLTFMQLLKEAIVLKN